MFETASKTITIQALRINGEAVTTEMFRQLPLVEIFREDGSLRPFEPWGIVRYAFANYRFFAGKVWVVGIGADGYLARARIDDPDNKCRHAQYAVEEARQALWRYVRWEVKWQQYAAEHPDFDWETRVWTDAYDEEGPVERYFQRGEREDRLRKVREEEYAFDKVERQDRARQDLLKLPQLFIAV